ncbi:MAG: hypothetical protein GXO65_04445, partial [Euryarchaeota archaeon]|nr:hypothetical protein [Euryarchaeota archaeon]
MKPNALIIAFLLAVLVTGCLSGGGDLEEGEDHVAATGYRAEPWGPPTGDIAFGVEEVGYDEVAEDIPGWFDAAAERGIGLVGLDVMDLDGYIAFDSPTLRQAGFKEDPDYGSILPEILQEAKRHDIRVIVMLEGMAHILTGFAEYSKDIHPDRLTPEAVGQVVRELAGEAGKAGVPLAVNEEAFEEEYIDAISRAARETGVEYIHFFEDLKCRPDLFLSEDYAYYPYNARHDQGDQDYMRSLIEVGSYYGELGNLNVMYGAARGCGIEAGT